ncbi:hypothetical protein DLD82_06550 [Methanospirillum stamsii]|uniref:Uncharacterized protein n=1 Tax=Methanospirillum stamsii TaxID=1277351 RepID=A0A2V2N8V4_9EURY|nr:hypothetical protein DLD82_06550 [Methanospirillum stamsii]
MILIDRSRNPVPERLLIQLWKAGNGHVFSDEQALWLEIIRDHIGTSLSIEIDDLDNLQVFL